MKLALLSDVHANLQALEACLDDARARGADRVALLGDLVGYGGDPSSVLQLVQDLHADGAIVLKGNHDALAVKPPPVVKTVGDSTAGWTHSQLDDLQRAFLDNLPLTVQLDSTLLVHASLNEPESWRYVYDEMAAAASLDAAPPEVRHVFGGHVHLQNLYYRGAGAALMRFQPTPGVAVPVPRHRHWLATIGSVGQPRDGNPQAMYALFDTVQLLVTFVRVNYDHAAAAAAVRRAGLPEFFAARLESGR